MANVETLAHVALIARYGPAWFRQAGSPDAPGTMLVTLTGAVRMPGVFEIEAGTPVGDVLAMAGAGSRREPAARRLLRHLAPGRRTSPRRAAVRGRPAAGGRVGRGRRAARARGGRLRGAETARILRYLAQQGAQQCGPCRFGLPAIADDFTRLAASRADRDLVGRLGAATRA